MHSLLNHANDNLQTLQRLYVLAELIDAVLEEGEPNPYLYSLLVNGAVITRETGSLLVFESFKTKLLSLSGSLPHLKHCHTCKEKCANDEIWISEECLHLYCTNCKPTYSSDTYTKLTLDCLKLLCFISTGSFENILRIKINEKALSELCYLNNLLLKQILNCELRSTQKSLVPN